MKVLTYCSKLYDRDRKNIKSAIDYAQKYGILIGEKGERLVINGEFAGCLLSVSDFG